MTSCSDRPEPASAIGEAFAGPMTLPIRQDISLKSAVVATVKHVPSALLTDDVVGSLSRRYTATDAGLTTEKLRPILTRFLDRWILLLDRQRVAEEYQHHTGVRAAFELD